jgi:hypothetical protein
MFGYVKPYPPELKVKEYDFYRSVYCGLCRALGQRIALCAELTLSYDIVYLALLAMALRDEKTEIVSRRCAAHPFKKRPMVQINDSLILSAETGALLSYYKLIDDLHDHRGLRRLPPLLLYPAAKYLKSKINVPKSLDDEIKRGLESLNKLETEHTASVDAPAEVFGHIMSAVFARVCGDGNNRLIGEVIGRHTGRWIYIVDALDDFEKDKKRGSYNPFLYNPDIRAQNMENALTGELINIEKAVNIIDFNDSGIENIIKNIIYLGMPRRASEIINKKDKIDE